jgi:hypothetical protein
MMIAMAKHAMKKHVMLVDCHGVMMYPAMKHAIAGV